MDLATIIGLGGGFLLIIGTLLTDPKSAGFFINIPSLLVTVGGAFMATFIAHPMADIKSMSGTFKKALFHKSESPPVVIKRLVNIAGKARKEGILALDRELHNIKDDFVRSGLELVIDGLESDLIKTIMETKISFTVERHKSGQAIFVTLGALAPAFGMIGTLIGLVQMLAALDDPSSIGTGMATALVTTFYGAVLANLVFIPIAGKLKIRSTEEMLSKELALEGILSIQAGDNPKMVEMRLKAFLQHKAAEALSADPKKKK